MSFGVTYKNPKKIAMGLAIGNAIGVPFGVGGKSWGSYDVRLSTIYINKDTLIASGNPTFNYGAGTSLAIGEYNSAVMTTRTLIDFDLSGIADEDVLSNVYIIIYHKVDLADNDRTLRVYRMKRSWTEGTKNGSDPADGATWNTYDGVNNWTAPGGFDVADCEQTEIGSLFIPQGEAIGKWLAIPLNITSKSELSLGYGLMLKMDTELNDGHSFHSRHSTGTTYDPKLIYCSSSLVGGSSNPVFTKSASNPLFTGFFGSILQNADNTYSYYYCKLSDNKIYKRDSTDGITWGAESSVITTLGFTMDVCSAWREGGTYYMLYRGNEWGGSDKIGLATSADGINWTKEVTNPVIANTDIGAWCTGDIDPWGIIKIDSTYYLWVNDVGEVPRQSGLMTSTDLINWTPHASNPIFDNGRFCASPIKYNDKYYLFVCYTPLGNLGIDNPCLLRIELYRDANPTFLPATREYLGVVLLGGSVGEWDFSYLDTPSILTKNIQRDQFISNELWMYYTGYNSVIWNHGLSVGYLSSLSRLKALIEPSPEE